MGEVTGKPADSPAFKQVAVEYVELLVGHEECSGDGGVMKHGVEDDLPGVPVERMNGTWQQNKAISDGTDELCQMLSLGWVFKQALDKSDILQVWLRGSGVDWFGFDGWDGR